MSTKRKPAVKPVYLEWVDACGKSGWQPVDAATPPITIKSIGYVMRETPEYISLSPGWDEENEHFMSFVTIPKGWIRRRKNVKL